MRLTLDLLGHRFQLSLNGLDQLDDDELDDDEDDDEDDEDDEPKEQQPQRDSQLDSLVERADPYMPPIGFYPASRYE